MTPAERQARRRKRAGKKINRRRRKLRKLAKAASGREATRIWRTISRTAPVLPDGCEYRIGDCREVLANIANNSVALVLTDPPWTFEADPLYEWLAQFAARVLMPGGSLILYTGHTRLNRDCRILDQHLTYHSVCRVGLAPSQRMFGKNIISSFRPILWHTKGQRRGTSMMPDTFVSPARDKLAHAWAQGEGGVWVPIEHLSDPGELIVDPFAGTGTWGRIAASMGRRWIGCDIAPGGTTTVAAAIDDLDEAAG